MNKPFYANRYAAIIYRCSSRYLARALRERGVPFETPQLPVFLRAGERPGIPQEDIAALTGLDKATVARAAAVLAQQGLVLRTPDPADRRAYRLTLTAAGQALRPRVLEAVDGLHVVLYRGMGEEGRAQACRLLVQMCANLRAELGDPALPAPQTAAEPAGNC